MAESGIDLGFDFAELSSEDLILECGDLLSQEESLAFSSSQNDHIFYELKSRTVPERLVSTPSILCNEYVSRVVIVMLSVIVRYSIFIYKTAPFS